MPHGMAVGSVRSTFPVNIRILWQFAKSQERTDHRLKYGKFDIKRPPLELFIMDSFSGGLISLIMTKKE